MTEISEEERRKYEYLIEKKIEKKSYLKNKKGN